MNTIDNIDALNKLQNPPKKLFFKGNLEFLNMLKVSIVGSRKMSFYTKSLVLQLSSALSKRGVCVVSGGALGVDITAHKGAFPNTIAVFANGLDIIYPKTNEKNIKEIYENSLALSEYEPKTRPLRHHFLQRNRIVVALSEALVVAQAELRSGSLQSARLAMELGIPVYVLPHQINESIGTNELLATKKANLIYNIDKFADKFGNLSHIENDNDEVIEFIKTNSSFNDAHLKFGDLVYEYELQGKIEILGSRIVIK
ncbi:DNA-processing protein DprA [Campylobacter blaseri]|uniref:DNA-protecting protein DprA n=1 Tax=Campylobacter blaseri TaxID=2042961 RepID=A0A2P8R2R0_9BACT|nr:DNA-processing protein DprA [Campylobacter blaseri]PSM52783.1 DNA-protecting protein DprA [Campylobacter blaseri]PSM54431.1 DNA-protecting protein DprA [Campylobacter blaseri]